MTRKSTVKCPRCDGTGELANSFFVGAQMRKLREKAGINGAEIARRVGLHRAHIFNLEKGYRGWSPDVIKRYTDSCKAPQTPKTK